MKTTIQLSFLIVFYCGLKGQSLGTTLISSAGSSYNNNDVQLDWALGELAINTHENDLVLTEGFFQPQLFLVSNTTTETFNPSIKVYPNPTIYSLKIVSEESVIFNCKVIDQSGRLVLYKSAITSDYELNVQHLLPGTYHLFLIDEQFKPFSFTFVRL